MTKLTIIVPGYNMEKTILRTLDSIVPQLNETIQLMIINDGSTDDSERIIKDYIADNNNISYYKKENEGVAASRNFGIVHSNSEYVMFVDSDDYINKDLIEQLQPYMEQGIDIIKYKAQHVDNHGNIIKKLDGPVFSNLSGEETFSKLAFSDILMDSPCVYVLKKDLFTKNDLLFKTGTYHEDFGLIPLLILLAKSVASLDIYGYNYVQTDDSITRNNDYEKTIKKFEDVLKHYDNMIQFLDKFDINNEISKDVKAYYTNSVLLRLKDIRKEDRKKYIKEIKNRKILRNIKVIGIRQIVKKIILYLNINWYLYLVK